MKIAHSPRGVLQISSDRDDQRMFLCLKFSIPGIFGGQENLASIFLVALSKQGFFGNTKQSEDFPHLPDAEKISSDGMMNKQTKTFNTRLLKGRSVYSHNCNNHNETDVLQQQQNMQSINSSLRNRVIAWDPNYARTH